MTDARIVAGGAHQQRAERAEAEASRLRHQLEIAQHVLGFIASEHGESSGVADRALERIAALEAAP